MQSDSLFSIATEIRLRVSSLWQENATSIRKISLNAPCEIFHVIGFGSQRKLSFAVPYLIVFFFSRQSSEQTKSFIRFRGGDGSQESISLGFNVVDKVGDRILSCGRDRKPGE